MQQIELIHLEVPPVMVVVRERLHLDVDLLPCYRWDTTCEEKGSEEN